MTHLEMCVHYTDGTAKVERCERDDAKGREIVDKIALAKMASSRVRYVSVERTVRHAQEGRRR